MAGARKPDHPHFSRIGLTEPPSRGIRKAGECSGHSPHGDCPPERAAWALLPLPGNWIRGGEGVSTAGKKLFSSSRSWRHPRSSESRHPTFIFRSLGENTFEIHFRAWERIGPVRQRPSSERGRPPTGGRRRQTRRREPRVPVRQRSAPGRRCGCVFPPHPPRGHTTHGR